MEEGIGDSSSGKGPQAALDDLPREELLQKCKQFLQFAQKAKKAKDDAVKQIGDLRETLSKSETLKGEFENWKPDFSQKTDNWKEPLKRMMTSYTKLMCTATKLKNLILKIQNLKIPSSWLENPLIN